MPTSKTYEVVGTAPILDHQPGETFEADIPPEQEAFLVAIGGLKIVGEASKPVEVKRPEIAPAKVPAPNVIRRDADGH